MSGLINRKEKIGIIHVARKDRGLDDVSYRALLYGAAGVESSADIETENQFAAIMRAFNALGFERKPSKNKRLDVSGKNQGTYCSYRQIYYIKGLWELASRSKDEKSLQAMVRRVGRVDDIRFLTPRAASAMIQALRDMCIRAGINPDGPGRGEFHEKVHISP